MTASVAPKRVLPAGKPVKRTFPPIPFSQVSASWLEGNPERLKTHEMFHVNVTQRGRGFRLYSPSKNKYVELELTAADRITIAGRPKVTEMDVLAFASQLTETQKLALIQKIAASVATSK